MAESDGTTARVGTDAPAAHERRIRPARGLPGGRAVVGALLVTASAVAVFASYLRVTAEPTTAYLVANRTIEPGTRFATRDDVLAAMTSDAIELSPAVSARAIPVEELDRLIGHVVLAPLEFGDLVLRSALGDDDGVALAQTLSFSLAASDAVAGTLRAGERVDVLATYGSGDEAYTAYVVRGVPLLRVVAADGGSGAVTRELSLSVAVSAMEDVQALGHAVNTAAIFVTRSTAGPQDTARAPGAYRASPEAEGPAPDPAGPAVGGRDTARRQDGDEPDDVSMTGDRMSGIGS